MATATPPPPHFKANTLQQALRHPAVPSAPLIPPARCAQINLLPIPCMPEATVLSLQSLSLTSASCGQPGAGLAGGEELVVYLEVYLLGTTSPGVASSLKGPHPGAGRWLLF